jgi:hypothetical protein
MLSIKAMSRLGPSRACAIERFKCKCCFVLKGNRGSTIPTLYTRTEESERVQVNEDGEPIPTTKSSESRLRRQVKSVEACHR